LDTFGSSASLPPSERRYPAVFCGFNRAEQVQLTGEYEHSPIVTADNTLTLVKKETGIG